MLHKCVELIPEELLARARKLSSALICDGARYSGLDLKNDGCFGAECKPVSDSMKVLGTALTVHTEGGSIYPIQVAIKYAGPGYVLVVDTDQCRDRCLCGDIVMSTCKAVGAEGLVIDGYVRDKEGLKKLGFPVFSLGVTPRSPVREKCGSINEPIVCCGIKVAPGDLIIGDADGVVAIPREHIALVLDKAEEKRQFEEKRIEQAQGYCEAKQMGKPLPEIIPKWALDFLKTELKEQALLADI